MATNKRRRAPSADWLAMTPADREAVRQSRVNAQSSRYQRETAVEKSFANASPRSSTK
ncbi:hypothetical protein [Massilia sp. HP4]|uniref:hypothetical protein n=1 Tax=Massilia sp. HP4 TaxID=2562316 RepID=UPI001484E462|nr:hypothetical protein [Massilia sp. HP4]